LKPQAYVVETAILNNLWGPSSKSPFAVLFIVTREARISQRSVNKRHTSTLYLSLWSILANNEGGRAEEY